MPWAIWSEESGLLESIEVHQLCHPAVLRLLRRDQSLSTWLNVTS